MGHKSVSHFLTLRLIMKSRVSTPLGAVPLIFGLTIGLILPYLFRTPRNCENLHPAEEPQLYNPLSRPSRKLLFVGVITADQFLETRARAVYETWGQSLPGSIAFFSSENSTSSSVPVVSLSGIDDVYPPQKKSLTMLKYMYDHLVDKYDWFMRCDDDVYVRTDKLSSFLLKLNSSEELYIGQPGVGLNKERGRLGLAEGENFCMGGPGVIISRMTLRRLGPLISTCLGQFASSHEDVEVGRCIRLATGISCTWAFEMQALFYNSATKEAAFEENLNVKSIRSAITLHPLKRVELLYRLHVFLLGLRLSDVLSAINDVDQYIIRMNSLDLADVAHWDNVRSESLLQLTKQNSFQSWLQNCSLETWDMITPRNVFSYQTNSPISGLAGLQRESMNLILGQVMDFVNAEASVVLQRLLEFKRLNFAYRRWHPFHGVQYVMDLLMSYHRHLGYNRRRMTVHVRHHVHVQQPFGNLLSSLGNVVDQSVPVNIILPLSGRHETFLRFLQALEICCLIKSEPVGLTVVYFYHDDRGRSRELYNIYTRRFSQHSFLWLDVNSSFSRGVGLQLGARQHPSTALLFLCDVDLIFDQGFIRRCRGNAAQGREVYFPIVFSQFDPDISLLAGRPIRDPFHLDMNSGSWRPYAFGMTCIYNSDLVMSGGLNTTIQGWGLEDVDFYSKVVSTSLSVVRSPDPGLVHIYHPVSCGDPIPDMQRQMCLKSKAVSYASNRNLADLIRRLAKSNR